jgi:hypothetical protein
LTLVAETTASENSPVTETAIPSFKGYDASQRQWSPQNQDNDSRTFRKAFFG